MDIPGEKLVIKMWETIADKGIGSLLKPWQIRREGRAGIELKRNEILFLAQAEKDAEDIRSGYKSLLPDGTLSKETGIESSASSEPIKLPDIVKIAERNTIAEAVRKEINLAKAVIHAENELAADSQEPCQREISDDWLFRWREYAAKVSSEQLQQLWGKVLAGEVKNPGNTSYRLLELINQFTENEIQEISKIFSLVEKSHLIIIRGTNNDARYLTEQGLTKDFFQKASEIGIISTSTSGPTNVMAPLDFEKFDSFTFSYSNLKLSIQLKSTEKKSKKHIIYYELSSIGKQLFTLSSIKTDIKYIESLRDDLLAQGVESTIAES